MNDIGVDAGYETVTITVEEYNSLVAKAELLDFLQSRGVDNWQGYGYPPDREDYDTDEEYEAAYDCALYDY